MMELKVLASSSKGNAYILNSPTGSLVLECGISHKDILKGLDFQLGDVLGALVTHSHLDHSKSAKDLMNLGIDLYTSRETTKALDLKGYRVNIIQPLKPFSIRDFQILAFPTEHDAREPLGFLIQYKPTKEKLLFITDSYYCKYKFKNLNYIMIECNYIKETLNQNIEAGYIPIEHKPRLLQSHFSLENVKKFLQANDLSQCQSIVLLHLSDMNSDSERMIREIEELTGIKPYVADSGLVLDLEMFPY